MSEAIEFKAWVENTDTLAALLERANEEDVEVDVIAEALMEHGWDHAVPKRRVKRVMRMEQERLEDLSSISLSVSSRSPRYIDVNDLDLLSGHEFEHVLAEVLRRIEGEATVTEGSGDQGVDVVWERESETVGIQAKAYSPSTPVGNSAVQEIYTGSVVRDSEYAIDTPAVVTTSRYTQGAREAAETSDVTLHGRSDLTRWLSKAEMDAEVLGTVLDEA